MVGVVTWWRSVIETGQFQELPEEEHLDSAWEMTVQPEWGEGKKLENRNPIRAGFQNELIYWLSFQLQWEMSRPGLTQVPPPSTDQGQSSMAVDGLAQHTALLPTRTSPIAKGLTDQQKGQVFWIQAVFCVMEVKLSWARRWLFLILKLHRLGLGLKTGVAGGTHSLASVWDCPVQCRGTLILPLLSTHYIPPTQLPIQIWRVC